MSDTATIEDRYLGDGVYASYDGYHIILDLRGQDSFTRIALEPKVFDALCLYRRMIGDAQRCATEAPVESNSDPDARHSGPSILKPTNGDLNTEPRGEADPADTADPAKDGGS